MKVELATFRDLDAVVTLLEVQLREHRITTPVDRIRTATQGLVEDAARGRILVLRGPDGMVAGVACLSYIFTVEHGGKAAWLEELFVVPARREKGQGTALLNASLAQARADGCRAMDLEIDIDHRRVASLYERHGFRPHTREHWVRTLD